MHKLARLLGADERSRADRRHRALLSRELLRLTVTTRRASSAPGGAEGTARAAADREAHHAAEWSDWDAARPARAASTPVPRAAECAVAWDAATGAACALHTHTRDWSAAEVCSNMVGERGARAGAPAPPTFAARARPRRG